MDLDLAVRAELRGGFLTWPDLEASGFSTKAVRRAMAEQWLVRIRHGAYVLAATYSALDDTARLAVRTAAVMHRLGDSAVPWGLSALAELGVPLWGRDLETVHVLRLDGGASRREAGVVHHVAVLDADDFVEVDGRRRVRAEVALWGALCCSSIESGLVAADGVLHRRLADPPGLSEVARRYSTWPGARKGDMVCRLCDPRAESVGETRSRYLCFRHSLPAPDLQVVVRTLDGHVLGEADMGWRDHRHLAEFDGAVKYGRLRREGETADQVVVREKRREDAMRAEDWGFTRIMWADLAPGNARRTAARLSADLDRSRRLYGPAPL
ncbi:MAG: type IV toxin-antitoxin system AbiEi family antitoxin domain-containing protein [Nocardioidaceae bacterium]|nr:type IV toxin-antitoxin system AbiEi family antitoxin domain-containing protein [Nocardioidaceae bacterium]